MNVMDKIRNMVGKSPDKAKSGIHKASSFIDEKTGGNHSEKIDQARDKAENFVDQSGDDTGTTDQQESENREQNRTDQ